MPVSVTVRTAVSLALPVPSKKTRTMLLYSPLERLEERASRYHHCKVVSLMR